MRRVWALAARDLKLELRGRAGLLAAFFFIGVVVFILGFALGPNQAELRRAGPGVWWVALAFAGSLLASRAWALEVENDTLDDLLLTPGSREWIYWGKFLFLWALMMGVGGVTLLLVAGMFFLPLTRAPELLLTLLLGGTGYAAIAVFYAGLVVRLRARDVLLPLLVFPLVVPVVLGAVKATLGVVNGAEMAEVAFWWRLLGVFDVVYLTACSLLFPWVIEG
ncbi:heme exporter protein CcmB [Marinithermus hydrothermalis]|uniref:Heme exporter protein B n=1 Tax=Marinithermus hydrothermalis (strain DSM 14884 / JCM 11576 / T1) TaxID=869210 RepID=F2NLU8_MARHT|nr:heme exporter protein CcmB [Marinithermus hydrothermalis]AEB11205.1 cytochrome c-type biogenesis protein CcmB [Marinithermus hydrothermalis DSM 14884]